MSQNKTVPTGKDVIEFLNGVENERRRRDAFTLLELISQITGEEATMWGPSIVGFGSYHYKYDSGREGDMLKAGFSPRKANTVVYLMSGFSKYEELLDKLGKHKIGKSCLYLTDLEKVDMDILKQMIELSVEHIEKTYPNT